MTSSSSPGISLKQEGISYIAGAELPCVIVNIMRGGPGLGGIQPSQSDYYQATRGGGHGDYRHITLAPSTVQELVDLTFLAFDLADRYRNPVMILGDGAMGQMMEPVEFPEETEQTFTEKPWATTGCKGRKPNIINTLYLDPEELEKVNQRLTKKYDQIESKETQSESYLAEDAELLVVSFGTTARVVRSAVDAARREGIRAGLFRPITLWPYPSKELLQAAESASHLLTVEMNCGQMVDDVRLAINGKKPVDFFGRSGGTIPTTRQVLNKIRRLGVEQHAASSLSQT